MRLRHKKNAETEVYNLPLVINYGGELCEPASFFGNDNPVHLELGMGKGRFITELSQKNPNINYIGVERSATIVLKAADTISDNGARITRAYGIGDHYEKIRTGELCARALTKRACRAKCDKVPLGCEPNLSSLYPNLRFICVDIAKLGDIFPPHSIDKIYLNFSDPWPKKRHEIRRLTHHNFLLLYEKLLKSDGIIEFKTDNVDLFDFTLEEIKLSNFKLIDYTYDLHNDEKLSEGNIMTEYEEKFSKLGNKICKLIIKK